MDNPPFTEDWGQGCVVFHNPFAKYNLPDEVFCDLLQCRFIDGIICHEPGHTANHTEEIDPELKAFFKKLSIPRCCLLALSPEEIRNIKHLDGGSSSYFQCGWFTDQTDSLYGILFQHKITERVKFRIFGLNKYQKFFPIYKSLEFDHFRLAKSEMEHEMNKILNTPKRYWNENEV